MTSLSNFGNLALCLLMIVLFEDTRGSNWNVLDTKSEPIRLSLHGTSEPQLGVERENVPNQECRNDREYDAYCNTYRKNDFCNKYPYGMQKHCALTCGLCKCKAKIDIGFLVDSSESIEKTGKGNYKRCLDFIKNAVNGSFISEQFTHVGLVLFSSKRKMVFDFHNFYASEPMMQAIEKAPYLKGGTSTGKALTYIKTELFDKTGRKDVPQVLIVMTDGKSADNITTPAANLHSANITVFALGIGRNYDMKQLKEIASKPADKYTFTADFNGLNGLYTSIRDDVCRVNSTLSAESFHEGADHQTAFGLEGSHVTIPHIGVL